jgi:cytochrome c oxidase cbb3-type subunit 4
MVSGIVTAILLVCFLGGTAWAYSSKRKSEFESAARIPLDDDIENSENTP